MSFIEFFNIVKEILQNWYVMGTLIAMLLMIAFADFIVRYRRKPKKSKKKKIIEAAPTPAPMPTPEAASDENTAYEE